MRPFPRVFLAALALSLAVFAAPLAARHLGAPVQASATAALHSPGTDRSTPASPAAMPLQPPLQRLAHDEAGFASATTPVERLVALYRLEETADLCSPATVNAALARLRAGLAALAKPEPLLTAELDRAQAGVDLSLGHSAPAAAIWRQLGVVGHWQAVGPFDNSSPAAIANEAGPEKAVNLSATYTGKQRRVSWRTMPFAAPLGEINLGSYLSPNQSASAYLVSWVRSPQARDVALRLRDNGSTRIWVNGRLVFDEQGQHRSVGFDQHAVGTQLESGWNEILAKVGDTESSDWHFSLRITTPDGEPLVLDDTAEPPHAVAPRAAGAPSRIRVADMTAMASAAASTPQGKLNYAWVLTEKQNFNAGGNDDANAFMAALASFPPDSAERSQAVLDFVAHDRDQSRRYRYLEQLLGREPGNAQAHLMLGTIELARHEYWPAREDFEQALGLPLEPAANAPPNAAPALLQWSAEQRTAAAARAPRAALGLAEVYAARGIRPEVLVWADALRGPGAESNSISGPLGVLLRNLGAIQMSLTWFEAAHAADASDTSISLELADAQRRSGQLEASLATLQQAAVLTGEPPRLLELEAQAMGGLGRGPAALALIQQAVTLAPDNPGLRVAQGELERHLGHPEAATAAWQLALGLNPQDADLRDRLRLVKGGEASQEASFERPYIQDFAQVVAAFKAHPHPDLQSGPMVVLANTEVTNIFPSGNTGRYVQQIFRINNTNGADSLSVYPVTYDPATEEVYFLTARVLHADGSSADAPQAGDQPITQSVGYETYYDVRNKFVVMPPMRPGDFVEIAYRVLPTTLESLYGDYYGDINTFGGSAPTLFQQYVVITPENKHLYYKAVRFPGQSEETEVNGNKVYRWSVRDLPAQVAEPDAPPAIEQSPYVIVSAFQTWNQFGNWYRQLIRDTFVMNGEMVQTVNQLVQGKTTEREKVDAIYRWVIQNTHYVALELGIHGFRPYPVTQVFHRRFGDCKDKASLLIAMLHQAGIPADFVLVRIRDLGLVDPSIPAVADFDHAIVYVPSLKLYLDGTAEYNGANELPAGDQRAFVLRIPVGADLAADQTATDPPTDPVAVPTRAQLPAAPMPLAPVVTPEQPASANVVTRMLNGQLDRNGDLHFELNWTLTGGQAPMFRQALEIPDRRAGALQAMLHSQLPGISVVQASVKNEDDWDQPIEITMTGTIPRFATVNGSTLLIPRQILPTSWLPRMAALSTRQTDLLTAPPQILVETMHLALPSGYQIAGVPPSTNLDRPFGSFQAAASLNGSTLTLQSRIETTRSLISPTQYPAFRGFWAQVDTSLGRPIAGTTAAAPRAAGGGGR